MATTQEKLTQALDARHKLLTGAQTVSFRVSTSTGDRAHSYTQVSLARLDDYIAELRREINGTSRTRNRISHFIPE